MTTSRVHKTLERIGYASLLWNRIESCWYLVFTGVLASTPRSVVDAIFRSAESGNKQRALVLRVAQEVWPADSPNLIALKNLQERTNTAATTRNHLMHADFHIAVEDGVADIRVSRGAERGKQNSLAFKRLDEALPDFIGTLRKLDRDMDALRVEIAGVKWFPSGPSLPDLIDAMLEERA